MILVHRPFDMNIRSEVISFNSEMALKFLSRLLGLMFRRNFGRIDGMIFSPCRAIHTFFMRFAIDVICVDETYKITEFAQRLVPNRTYIPKRSPKYMIELPAGTIERHYIKAGDEIQFYA